MTYWHLVRLNARWGERTVRGFLAAREDLQHLFAQRYPPFTQKT